MDVSVLREWCVYKHFPTHFLTLNIEKVEGMDAKVKTIRFLSLCAIALFLSFGSEAFAQGSGQIRGQVTDAETGEPLPGVNVTVVGTQRGAVTNAEGQYAIINVPVGTQSIRASFVGYGAITKTDVLVKLNQTSRINFELSPATIQAEEVTVTAEREIIKKEVSGSQQVVTSAQMLEAPAARGLDDFLSKQVSMSGDLGIRGGSPAQTGTIINGLTFTNNRMGTPETAVPLSAVDQVAILSGGFQAEHGNFRSGLIDITTKTGNPDAYHGRVDVSRSSLGMKRFGRSIYDVENYYLRPELDPDVAFMGTDAAWADDPYLQRQYSSFTGWNALAEDYNDGKAPEEQASPLDLYLWDAWVHMVEPPFDELEDQGYSISEETKQKFREHAHELEGSEPDWNIDAGFGGPLPFVSNALGNATFYLSHNSNRDNYTQPVTRDAVTQHTTMLSLQSNPLNSLRLTLTGLYKTQSGVLDVIKSHHFPTNLGRMMPAQNLSSPFMPSSQYLYSPGIFTPRDASSGMLNLELRQSIGSNTFWNLLVGGQMRSVRATPPWAEAGVGFEEFFEKGYWERSEDSPFTPNDEPVLEFGPIKVNEQPYGFSAGNQVVGGFAYNGYEQPFGSNSHRFAQVGPAWFDSTETRQLRARFDVSSQVTIHHMLKGGVELQYSDLQHQMRSAWFGHLRGNFTYYWDRQPLSAGVYLQDQIEYERMVANLGLRADYYDPGGRWPTGGVYNEKAYDAGGQHENLFNRWDEMGILEPIETHFILSPRLGVSFPVTEKSKFYFNYGHFRSLAPWHQMFIVRQRPRVGIQQIGNPNLEPPRTIAYETGVEYNLLDQFLIRVSGYYKDITGEQGGLEYHNASGTVNYGSWGNNHYEDIRGLELTLSKEAGRWITGWLNYDYMVVKSGLTGRSDFYEDPSKGEVFGLYQGQESTPLPQPRFNANVRFHIPSDFGPSVGGTHPAGGWLLSVLPSWQAGPYFTWNPLGKLHLQDNQQWGSYHAWDLKLSKRFAIGPAGLRLYAEVTNLFNNEGRLSGQAFANGTDRREYLASLHLPMYDSEEFDDLRANSPEGYYVPGNDEPGDLRSSEKPYINNPNQMLWRSFMQPRRFWFGTVIDF